MEKLELVVLFADADAERFVTTFIDRGIDRGCLRRFAWRSVRDPMHDAHVAGDPAAALAPFLPGRDVRYVVLWDHHGSGRDEQKPSEVERDVVHGLARAGIEEARVAAIAFVPELESALVPVWPKVVAELAKKRAMLPIAMTPSTSDPKGSLAEVLRAYDLHASPPLFAELAALVSVDRLKTGAALGRLAQCLVGWFGSEVVHD